MSGYIVKVGKKGELYTPKKLRLKLGIDAGSELEATVKNDEIVLKKRKKIVNLLEEAAVATATLKELKKTRGVLEKELQER